jgi:hypothetical protein
MNKESPAEISAKAIVEQVSRRKLTHVDGLQGRRHDYEINHGMPDVKGLEVTQGIDPPAVGGSWSHEYLGSPELNDLSTENRWWVWAGSRLSSRRQRKKLDSLLKGCEGRDISAFLTVGGLPSDLLAIASELGVVRAHVVPGASRESMLLPELGPIWTPDAIVNIVEEAARRKEPQLLAWAGLTERHVFVWIGKYGEMDATTIFVSPTTTLPQCNLPPGVTHVWAAGICIPPEASFSGDPRLLVVWRTLSGGSWELVVQTGLAAAALS